MQSEPTSPTMESDTGTAKSARSTHRDRGGGGGSRDDLDDTYDKPNHDKDLDRDQDDRDRDRDRYRDRDRDRDRDGSRDRRRKYRDREQDEDSERSHRNRRRRERERSRENGVEYDEPRRNHRRSDRVVSIGAPVTTDEERDEVIEVQILPQDDNWGDNTTAITGTSDRSMSDEDLTGMKGFGDDTSFDCNRYIGFVMAAILSLMAFLTPAAFAVIPRLLWEIEECGTECDGLFISMIFKMVILVIGSWALFFRKPKATYPRFFIFRIVIMVLILVLLLAYWLFFVIRVWQKQNPEYREIVLFAVSLVDALLFIHYISVILLELRQHQPMFTLKVVRSPDGMSRFYNLGPMSIQRTAAWILEQYYRDFQVYNPHLLHVPTSRSNNKLGGIKFYDLDASGNNSINRSRAILAANANRRDVSRNERFYEEQEYNRRVKKRKARLECAAEEAFTHIKRLHEDQGTTSHIMDPGEAAQAIFPSMARPLQKYLRVTRQQPQWTMDAVLGHLARCISYNLSVKAFLEAFFEPGPHIIQTMRDERRTEKWDLVSDTIVSGPVEEGMTFQLRGGEIQLQIFVMKLPHFKIKEEAYNMKSQRFTLRLQSETSV